MKLTLLFLSLLTYICVSTSNADVVLNFNQSSVGNHTAVSQSYGDRVMATTDGNGHSYDIVTGLGFGTTPNVEAFYGPGTPALWTTGYGDLSTVYINDLDGDTSMQLTLTADAGFEVGLFNFDVASFLAAGQTIQGMQVRDGNASVLWSVGSTFITGSTHNDIDFGSGLFAEELTLDIDLTGLGSVSDDIGLDNVQFGQRVAVPEPGTVLVMAISGLAIVSRRKKRL